LNLATARHERNPAAREWLTLRPGLPRSGPRLPPALSTIYLPDETLDLVAGWHAQRTLYGTPLVIDGVMYYEGSWNVLRVVDAATGRQLWEYDPRVIEHAGDRLRIMWDASRGIGFYGSRVYVATVDGRLIAVDARTGREMWSTLTLDPSLPLGITGAPRAFRGLVVIGTEWGAIRVYLDAYEARRRRARRGITTPTVLADLVISGREVKAALHAPKNGFFYVIDRANGRLISAEPFAEVTWATHVDRATGRPVETPGARYADGPVTVAPSALGAHSWHASAPGRRSWGRSRQSTAGPTKRRRGPW
jgi:outer membrane protein assembly factor BamB